MPSNNKILYILDVLSSRLSLGVDIKFDSRNVEYVFRFADKPTIRMPVYEDYYNKYRLVGCTWWEPHIEGVVVDVDRMPMPGYTLEGALIQRTNNGWVCNFDIAGFCYWTLTRLEEYQNHTADKHGRFSASDSIAYVNNYLDRPVVDEWLLVLDKIIETLLGAEPQVRNGHLIVTHDVDRPFRYSMRGLRGFLVYVKDYIVGAQGKFGILDFFRSTGHLRDPFNTFSYLIDFYKGSGVVAQFFFLFGKSNARYDGEYDWSDIRITRVLNRLIENGHRIGVHPSYDSGFSRNILRREIERFSSSEFNRFSGLSVRMHYLRWSFPVTPDNLAACGVGKDFTLGWAEIPGFRCGTCHEYPLYNHLEDTLFELNVQPLIIMDVSVLNGFYRQYVSVEEERAVILRYAEDLSKKCKLVGGGFAILWHNDKLSTPYQRELYESLIKLSATALEP